MFNNELWQKPAGGAGGTTIYDYQIPKSVRMNKVSDNNGANFSKTFSGSPTSTKKGTFSTWLKRASVPSNETHAILVTGAGGGSSEQDIKFENNKLRLSGYSPSMDLTTTQLFRDVSAWYHIVVAWDTTQGTSTNRVKAYVNGEQITSFSTSTYPSQDQVILWYSNTENRIGLQSWNDNNVYNGYMAETIGIDGTTYAASDFGETVNGVWVPKDASGLTFGNNGFYLNYASSSDLGNDVSGNNNDWTANNLAASDQTLDSPTFNSDSNANFPTINVLDPTIPLAAISEGNLKITEVANNRGGKANFGIPSSGKWYWEVYANNNIAQENWAGITGPTTDSSGDGRGGSGNSTTYGINFSQYGGGGVMSIRKFIAGTESGVSGSLGTTTYGVLGITVNKDDNEVKFYHNNTLYITNSIPAGQEFFPAGGLGGGTNSTTFQVWNYGQDGTFAGNATAQGNSDANGYGNFTYTPPTGFLALCSGNLPTADAVDPAQTDDDYPQELFSATLYTGNGSASARNIDTGVAADWVWIKNRGAGSTDHMLYDSSRGVGKYLRSNKSNAEDTSGTSLSAFNSDGFQLSDNGSYLNAGSNTYVAWNWRANGGTTSTNTQGSEDSTVQVDPSGGFSIVTYTGTESAATIGHGLSSAPQCILVKCRDFDRNWAGLFVNGVGNTKSMILNSTANADTSSGYWNNTDPTSTVFSIGGGTETNKSGKLFVAYCFADTEGYIKQGAYVGNGNDDGTFVYTGFRPAMMIIREVAVDDWLIYDDKRVGYNLDSAGNAVLYPNATHAENNQASRAIDILSNGFKLRTSNATGNAGSGNYIYLAISSNPFQYATAR